MLLLEILGAMFCAGLCLLIAWAVLVTQEQKPKKPDPDPKIEESINFLKKYSEQTVTLRRYGEADEKLGISEEEYKKEIAWIEDRIGEIESEVPGGTD